MSDELAHDFFPIIKVYKDGRVDRLWGTSTLPASIDPQTSVQSKDVVISTAPPVSVRLYIPKSTTTELTRKLPLLVYFHGGGFCNGSAFSPTYHNYLNSLVSEANVVAVSVDYRLVPEHPLPAAYEDSWATLKWVESHFAGNGPEEWLNRHANLNRVFFSGDSAGANIAHHMGLRVGTEKLVGFKLNGIVLVHPYFWGEEPIGGELALAEDHTKMLAALWRFCYPLTSGSDDPVLNPGKDPKLGELGCEKVLVCVAEKDSLKDRGWYYSEVLKKSGWNGVVEVMEAKEEQHVFHLVNPSCDNAVTMLKKLVSFIN
ncbi:putative carboxylesterase [Rosa chinensis]|uniref:Putative carboxylesterase n=1 Tax=Rosa chinensis TaxID=74649 RepID=A0A2P6PMJ7_ROSCH|nr:probable carboxylesterase 12 [Rosa chinensis]PRQ23159.1 putative carboxylesterase [Rosa chinensis]